ncbi:MAG: sugar phosphate isomerase/epimerase [Kiritimatiellae bacterium]|nr:sugar phosphate isomerase/epimerase [Kiritimatiellia bacterium]MDD5522440.1 sugar phosphate isomerase/epimerase [Kiritimatiellia bacterium]
MVGGLMFSTSLAPLFAASEKRFKIGAGDWSLGKMGNTAALEVAKQIGLDGIQVSLGSLANNMHLRQADVQQQYKDAAKQNGVEISSLAIGELNNVPYKSDPRTIEWVSDCIDVMQALHVKVTLLAFFGKGNLKDDKGGMDEVVRRLKVVAPKAEKAGVVLGIESYLSADEHMDIIQRVGSPAVQVYYDVNNSIRQGYDIYKEIRQLGRQHICEFHMKEKGALLGQGLVDYSKVRKAIDDIGYTGWIQIEEAVPKGTTVQESYITNLKFLRNLFPINV